MASSMGQAAMGKKSRTQETTPATDSGKVATTALSKPQLATLPTEMHLQIFKHLSPISSVCLGVTCRALYRIHWSLHQRVPFDDDDRLPYLLEYWMAPLVLWIRGETVRFVTIREFRHLEEVTRREKWRLEDQEHIGGTEDIETIVESSWIGWAVGRPS